MMLSVSSRVAVLHHPDCSQHLTGLHPEAPERVMAVIRALDEARLLQRLTQPPVREATRQDLCRVHQPRMIERVEEACRQAPMYLDPDTPVSKGSLHAALLAAGAGLTAADGILAQEYDRAFCCVRPPGHHAGRSRPAGFCLFNNLAVTAAHLLEVHHLNRVLIVDFDVHHGNGTQEIFYDTDRVYYLSAHLADHYPYVSGYAGETGAGRGQGFNMNLSFPAGTAPEAYMEVVTDAIGSVTRDYQPEFILISAGFDSHGDDSLGGLMLEARDFRTLTRVIVEAAESVNARGITSFLEGGYHLPALALSAAEHVRGLLGD